MVCRSLTGKSWDCNPSILKWMYTTMIRLGRLLGTLKQGTARHTLSKVQTLACLCITEALHLMVQGAAEVALFIIAKNGLGGGMMVSRRAWTSLSTSTNGLEKVD